MAQATPSDPARHQPDEVFDFDGAYGVRYEKLAHQLIPAYAQLFPATVALLEGEVTDDADVLVVGCGTGIELTTFGKSKPDWRLTGVDPSPQMIRLAQEKLRDEGLEDRCELLCGYTNDLPRVPAFDAATLFNVMHFLPDDGAKLVLLENIAARLRPGGQLVMVDLHGDPSSETFRRLMSGWQEFMLLRGLSIEERAVFLDRLRQGMHYVPATRILELLNEAGFGQVIQFYNWFLYGGWVAGRR